VFDFTVQKDRRFGAFFVSKERLNFIDIGGEREVLAELREIRMGRNSKDIARASQSLYRRIFGLSKLPQNLTVVSSNEFALIPIDLIMSVSTVESIPNISYADDYHSLVASRTDARQVEMPRIFGGIDFGDSATAEESPSSKTRSARTVSGGWRTLPHSAIEAKDVHRLIGGHLFVGRDATEENLIAMRSPSILHIATHGYFDSNAGVAPQVADQIQQVEAGLVFAGANDSAGRQRLGKLDGYASLLELCTLDLAGTQLVVLSGCDTGLGVSSSNLGLIGLRKAFRLAGAEAIVGSLKPVPDDAAKVFMGFFYRNLISGKTVADSLKASKLQMRKDSMWGDLDNWAWWICYGNGSAIPVPAKVQ